MFMSRGKVVDKKRNEREDLKRVDKSLFQFAHVFNWTWSFNSHVGCVVPAYIWLFLVRLLCLDYYHF